MTATRTVRITVRGRLSERLGAAFDGMTLAWRNGATELAGEVVDQAQVHGLLTRIRDLGLELESVTVAAAQKGGPDMATQAIQRSTAAIATGKQQQTMTRIVVDHYGGPEVLRVVEDEIPEPGEGEVRVRVLAAGVSFTDSQLRAGTYLGVPKPPFTPGYELVGVVDKVGPGCTRLRVGDRIASLTVWGAAAEYVCVREEDAVDVPEGLDPAEVASLPLTYMTAYQVLHREAKVKRGETVLVHGAAGRVGSAVLELGALAGVGLYGTAGARDLEKVERLGAVAIDYRNEDFLARARELPGNGVDVVLDGLGGPLSLRSFRALRRGGRLVVFGAYSTLKNGRKSRKEWLKWYAATAAVGLWGLLSPRRKVRPYRIQKLHSGHQVVPWSGRAPALPVGGGPRHPDWYREDWDALVELLREGKIHPVVAARMPLTEARRAHELLGETAATGKLVLVP